MTLVELITSIILVVAVAVIVDHVINEEAVRKWQDKTREARRHLDTLDVKKATIESNRWFLGFFDAIYDDHIWSRKRLIRSCLSSVLALFIIGILLQWQESRFASALKDDPSAQLILVLASLIVANLFADYFSLQETRWVMRQSAKVGTLGLAMWSIFDLIATTIIFLLFLISTLAGVDLVIWNVDIGTVVELMSSITINIVSDYNAFVALAPFLVSTFFTSFLWFMFIASALLLRAIGKMSPVLKVVLGAVAESETPARATGGFVCGALVLGYGMIHLMRLVAG